VGVRSPRLVVVDARRVRGQLAKRNRSSSLSSPLRNIGRGGCVEIETPLLDEHERSGDGEEFGDAGQTVPRAGPRR